MEADSSTNTRGPSVLGAETGTVPQCGCPRTYIGWSTNSKTTIGLTLRFPVIVPYLSGCPIFTENLSQVLANRFCAALTPRMAANAAISFERRIALASGDFERIVDAW